MRKFLVFALSLVLLLGVLVPVYASDVLGKKTGHISATFPNVLGGERLSVSLDYTLWVDGDASPSWPMKIRYSGMVSFAGKSKEIQGEDEMNDFSGCYMLASADDISDDAAEYSTERALGNGDKETYSQELGDLYLCVNAPPFWGGSDVGFRAWVKSQFSQTRVAVVLEGRLMHELNVWNHTKVLEVEDINVPSDEGVIAYRAVVPYAIATEDGKEFYGTFDGPSFEYYRFQATWYDMMWEVSRLLADGQNIYVVSLPRADYRKGEAVGHVYKFPYSGDHIFYLSGGSNDYPRYFASWSDVKGVILNLLDGKFSSNGEPVEVVRVTPWYGTDSDNSYVRAFEIKMPAIPLPPVAAARAYDYYYAWDKYAPESFPIWIVGVQDKSIDSEGKEHVSDYFYSGYGCSGCCSEIFERALNLENIDCCTTAEEILPAVDRVLFEGGYDGIIAPCYAHYDTRYRWMADWLMDAIQNAEKWKYIPGSAYLDVALGDTHINAYRNGKDVSRDVDVPAQIVNGRMLVPVRHISEPLGAEVGWDGKERKVTIKLGGHVVEMWIGNPVGKVDGKDYVMPSKVPPQIINNRTMVPLRFVAEALGAEVQWDYADKKAIIRYLPDTDPR